VNTIAGCICGLQLFTLVHCSWIASTLKMEVIRSSETSVNKIPTRRHIPEGGILHSHRRVNLKSHILILFTHLRLGHPTGLFPFGFPTNILYSFLFSPFVLYALPISSSLRYHLIYVTIILSSLVYEYVTWSLKLEYKLLW
jgi:hypothetical protein